MRGWLQRALSILWIRFRSTHPLKIRKQVHSTVLPNAAKTKPLAAFCLLVAGFLIFTPSFAANVPPMVTPGQFNVTDSGAFTYQIPIAVPPGTGGMVPDLSLSYSSQSFDGTLGMGWALGGLPTITRCPRTMSQDAVHGSVNFDSNDRYCLDGRRLVLINGTYGAANSEYRTEVEGFSKIVAFGTAGNGPAYFKVWTKAGQVMEFGNTADSQVLAVGKATARSWNVNKISDTKGNYLTVTYNSATGTDRTTNGEAYPTEIDYTGNVNSSPALTPYNKVVFVYTTRTYASSFYQAGSVQNVTVLLSDIKTYAGSSVVADYKLAYSPASSGASHDELISITQCDGTTPTPICLKPTTFGWQGSRDTLTMTGTPNSIQTETATDIAYMLPADFNGDGLTDFYTRASNVCNPYVGSAAGTFSVAPLSYDYYSPGGLHVTTAPCFDPGLGTTLDFMGSGFSDLIFWFNTGSRKGGYNIALKNIGGTLLQQPLPREVLSFAYSRVFDYNGDGRDDLLSANILEALGTGFFTPVTAPPILSTGTSYLGDFDGDGCSDFLVQSSTSTSALVYSCNPAVAQTTVSYWANATIVTGDFNGDKRTDVLVAYANSPGTLYLSTGTGLVATSFSVPSDWGKYIIEVGDWNGDGKADLILIAGGIPGGYGVGTSHKIFLSTGTGFVQAAGAAGSIANTNPADTAVRATIADWNNDGAADIWLQKPSGDIIYTFAYVPELMTTVTNGLGIQTTVTYDRLNKNGTFYAKGTSGVYPAEDIDGSFYVVSRVDSSNGLGACVPPNLSNCYSSKYAYVAAQIDLSGRGFNGFQKVIVTDLQTNIVQTTQYRQDFPFTGLIASQTKALGAVTLNSTSNVFEEVSLGTGLDSVKRWFVGLHQTIVSSNDYDGTTTYTMPTSTTSYVYDCDTGSPSICSGASPTGFGNTTQITADETYTSDNATKITTNAFDNDATNWFLGRLRNANVQSTVNAMPVLTRHTSYTYDPSFGLLTSEIIEPGAADPTLTLETDYGYDAFGNKTSSVSKGCVWISPTQCTIDAVGNPTSVRTAAAAFDQSTYHGSFLTTATNAKSQSENWTYDLRFGEPISHTGPNGVATTWSYDTFGRKTLETRADGNKTIISYTYCSGLPSGEACPASAQFDVIVTPQNSTGAQNAPITITYYDGLSRVIASDVEGFDGPGTSCTLSAPCWVRTATQYDANGRVAQTSRPYFLSGGTPKWTVNTYDALSRVKQTTFPDSSKVAFGFQGLTTTTTNDKGQTTTTVKNAQGQIATVTNAYSKTTTYVYDAFGDQITITDPTTPTHNIITNTFDLRGRKLTSFDPDMGGWSYVYDGFGELTQQTDAKSQVTTLTYDALGRMLSRVEPGLTSTWTFDTASGKGIGKLASATAGANYTRTLAYDTLGRPLTTQFTVDGVASTYTSSYNADGRLASVTYPSGLVLIYVYSATGYVCRMADNTGTPTCASGGGSQIFWTANTRDAEMHLTEAIAGNGVITDQAFDPNTGLIQTITAGPIGNPTSVADFVYGFDTLGNLTSRQDILENYTERFCYDNLNRLTNYALGATCTSSGTKTIGYDALGNITSKSDVGTYNYSLSGAGPHAVTSITGTVNGVVNPTFVYDANGNQTCEYATSGGNCTTNASRLVTWTSFNMASQVTQGSTVVNFTYDSEHARVKQVIGLNTTYYLNDPSSGVMSEKLLSGTTTTWNDYILADGKIIAQRTAVVGGGTALNYFVLDHLGSISVIADAGGNVITGGRLSYDAWGRRRNANGTDAATCTATTSVTTRGFTNQEEMDSICAINLNARIYDPTVAKFLSADPIVGTPFDLQQLNRYAYVINNPLSLVDPTGLCFLGCFWQSPIFSVILDVGLFFVGLPELEGVLGLIDVGGEGLFAAFNAANAAGLLVINAGIAGGISGAISTGSFQGALISAGSAAAFAGLAPGLGKVIGGTLTDVLGQETARIAGNLIASGLIGGLSSVAQGGSFGSGFLAAGVGSLAGPLTGGGGITPQGVLVSAALGGAASALGGGKFANGAITGAFAYAAANLAEEGGQAATSNSGPGGGSSRPLTPGEIALAQANEPNSGDQVDWSHVTLSPCNCTRSYTFGDTVYLDDKLSSIPDFSAAGVSVLDTSTLIHEFVHVWQYENWGAITYLATAAVTHSYAYSLYPNTNFNSMNMEQQAMIFQDYYLVSHGSIPLEAINSPSLQTYQNVTSQVHH